MIRELDGSFVPVRADPCGPEDPDPPAAVPIGGKSKVKSHFALIIQAVATHVTARVHGCPLPLTMAFKNDLRGRLMGVINGT